MADNHRSYLDLRKVIGSILTIYGVLIGGYGLIASPTEKKHLDGFNLDLWWGIVILIIGLAFLVTAWLRPLAKIEKED